MKYRKFGSKGPEISEIGFGAWAIGGSWGEQSDKDSLDALDIALGKGVNFIDTAAGYGNGRSERIIGEFLKQRSEQVYVCTKTPPAHGKWPPSPYCRIEERYSEKYLRENVEERMKNLQVECLDVLLLHTWTRDLRYHPHVHFLVTGGGLTVDKAAWRMPQNSRFLMPGRVLSELFRNRLRDELGDLSSDDSIPIEVWRTKWVVHVKHAGSGKEVLEYLSRYVHRVALPNSRLVSFDGEQVTFRYRDGCTQEMRRCTLSCEEFLRRFLQHVLPKGLVKIRRYGLFASARKSDLERARDLLEHERLAHNRPRPDLPQTDPEDEDLDPVCPECGVGRLRILAEIEPVPVLRVSLPRAPPGSANRSRATMQMLIS